MTIEAFESRDTASKYHQSKEVEFTGVTLGASSPDGEERNVALLGCESGNVGIMNSELDVDADV